MKFKALLYILLVCLLMINPACDSSTATRNYENQPQSDPSQPYQHTGRWDWVAPILEGGWCGPAAVYQIMAFYGDHDQSYDYRVVLNYVLYDWADDLMPVPDIHPNNPILISDTEFGLFLQPDPYGSSWAMLQRVGRLYRSRNLDDPLYDLCVCTGHTEPEHVEIRRLRLRQIHDAFLSHDIPVIVHLDSGISGYGHYVTVIGYEPEAGRVYYVDSMKHDEGMITVAEDDFLATDFYQSGLLYSARWDGEWMAFWHHGEAVACTACVVP
jgi:hypothetical protein